MRYLQELFPVEKEMEFYTILFIILEVVMEVHKNQKIKKIIKHFKEDDL